MFVFLGCFYTSLGVFIVIMENSNVKDTIVLALELIANFSNIPKMSSIKALGIAEKIFKIKTQWKGLNPRKLHLAPPSFLLTL